MIKFFLSLIHDGIGFIAAVMSIFGISISFGQIELGIAVILLGLLILAVYWFFFMKPLTISNPPSHHDLQDYFTHLEKDFTAWTKLFVIGEQQWGQFPIRIKLKTATL